MLLMKYYRPVIKDNTPVAASCQNNILLLWRDSKLLAIILWHVISAKLNIGKKITGLEIMTLKKSSMFPDL